MISTQTSTSATEATTNILGELQETTFVGYTSHYKASIHTFNGAHHPALMRLVCRLRDEAFRNVGIRMSDSLRIEQADTDGTCHQLIVWDNTNHAILGGYRYAIGRSALPHRLPLSHYYALSQHFIDDFLPHGIELSRTFINIRYQQHNNPQSIYALDSLWEGLAHIINDHHARYLFGRVSFYPTLGDRATNLLIGFMRHAFAPSDDLIVAHQPLDIGISGRSFNRIFKSSDPSSNYRTLLRLVHTMGQRIPPIITSYMRLSPSLHTYDAYLNNELGGITEAAILLDTADLYPSVEKRYNIHSTTRPTNIIQQHNVPLACNTLTQ